MIYDIPDTLIRLLRDAKRITVLTGAGVSAESGVPTFRQAQTGLWAQYDPAQLATPAAFRRDPTLVWDWYAWRRQLVGSVDPNPGHYALAEMERHVDELVVVTQNVDSLHQRAGSTAVIELHGNISRIKCFDCERPSPIMERSDDLPPRCPACGGFLRPDVVWFTENLPSSALDSASRVSRECDLYFAIGTSAIVHPAAALPLLALEKGIPLVEINPQPTPLTKFTDFVLNGPSGEILPQLLHAAWPTLTV
jgi:NAD-dependent deacetylase